MSYNDEDELRDLRTDLRVLAEEMRAGQRDIGYYADKLDELGTEPAEEEDEG